MLFFSFRFHTSCFSPFRFHQSSPFCLAAVYSWPESLHLRLQPLLVRGERGGALATTTATATRTPQNNRFNEQKQSLHVRFMFLYISLPSSAKQQREMTKFKVFWRTWAHDGEFSIFLPYLNAVPINLVPGYFAHIVQVERIGIIAK